jgi:nucleoid-associated protein YgaU
MLNREQDQAEFASPPVPPTDNETYRAAKPLIPFGLTQAERKNLVRLQRPSRANQIDVGTTRFKSYTSQPGDTLQNLSTRYYGRPDFYLDIYLANKARLRNPGYLPAGVELQIPIY